MDNRREIEIKNTAILGKEDSMDVWGSDPEIEHLIDIHGVLVEVEADYNSRGKIVIKSRLVYSGLPISDWENDDYSGSVWEDLIDVIEDEYEPTTANDYTYYGVSPADFV